MCNSSREIACRIRDDPSAWQALKELRDRLGVKVKGAFKEALGFELPQADATQAYKFDLTVQSSDDIDLTDAVDCARRLLQTNWPACSDPPPCIEDVLSPVKAVVNRFGRQSLPPGDDVVANSVKVRHQGKSYISVCFVSLEECSKEAWSTPTNFVAASYVFTVFLQTPERKNALTNVLQWA